MWGVCWERTETRTMGREGQRCTPACGGVLLNGAFIGVESHQNGCRTVFPIGKLEGLRFMCVFRFKTWGMTQRMGTCGQEIPFETQFLLVEAQSGFDIDAGEDQDATTYAVFLPLLEGDFRAVLQGNDQNEIEQF